MVERNVTADHVTIWRWVQRYAPQLHRRCRSELRTKNRSWRVVKLIFALPANGPIYIEQWILRVPRLTFYCRPAATQALRSASSRRRCGRLVTHAHG